MRHGVYIRIGIVAVIASAGHAAAQTTINLNAADLLQPFSGLTAFPSVLATNLDQAIAVNNGATAAQRAQAVIDNTITSDTGAVVADGLGTKLNGAYQAAITAGNPLLAASGNIVQAFRQANGISQADSGFDKFYFSNSTTNGTTPSTRVNPNPNIYAQAYGAGTPPDAFGDPRPFQVAPTQIQNIAPTITAGLVNNPAFPSGHTTFGYTQTLLFAQAVPEAYQQLVTRGSEYGDSRIVLGAHYPLDVIAGRILATYDVAQLLNNNPQYLNQNVNVFAVGNVTTSSDYAGLFSAATTDLRNLLQAGCGGSIASCVATSAPDRFSDSAADATAFRARLTYGLPNTGATNAAPVVPVGAEVLLATRLPFLTAAQRRDVLATTELPSGGPLDNGSGWARLDLYRAAGGYGAFNGAVSVVQDASLGGFNAAATFSNNIGGTGSLTKSGTGALTLSGNNSYTGGTTVAGGRLVAASSTALGLGNVSLTGGTLVDAAGRMLAIGGNFAANAASILEFDITGGYLSTLLTIGGTGQLGGELLLDFLTDLGPDVSETFLIEALGGLTGDFSSVVIEGLSRPLTRVLVRTATGYNLTITAVPEPASLAILLGGLVAVGALRRRLVD